MTPLRFIVGFGLVSASADVVYEGARSVIGPYLGSLGATAVVVGVVTGAGEACALVLRLFTGRIVDRTQRPWPQTVLGYALTALCVPLLAVGGGLWTAGLLYSGERVGKAVRTPARDTMLAQASSRVGRGYGFGLHEALDQIGAMAGPLLIAGVLAATGSYHWAFVVLAVPGAFALLTLARLQRLAPDPQAWEPRVRLPETKDLRLDAALPKAFWQYAAFCAATMSGFSTWGVIAFHLTSRHVIAAAGVPVLYAAAMGAAAAAALASGRLYDRAGMRGLMALPPLAIVVPVLAFSSNPAAVVAGALVWGAGMGVHDSTMRAAVTDLVPAGRRGAGFGTFTAIYGIAWLAGAVVIGSLYERSALATTVYVTVTQLVAAALLVPVLTSRRLSALDADRAH